MANFMIFGKTPQSSFNVSFVEESLKGLISDIKVLWVNSTESTNEDLMKLADDGESEWTLLVAGHQTKGRGRHQRLWVSPQGGLYFSLLLKPEKMSSPITLLPLMVGMAMKESFLTEAHKGDESLQIDLKWPNDLITRNGKLAGILCETSLDKNIWTVVVGVGINVQPLNPDSKKLTENVTTSLYEEADIDWQHETIIVSFISNFYHLIKVWKSDPEKIRQGWKEMSGLIDKAITVNTGKAVIEGVAVGINDHGALKIETVDGTIEINAAEGLEVKR
jgi:BirA family transcriptional regulator, biotin operon repressor / biotin---[acetyl-CoA-carboxylase] ligase